ncbi:hypothetical protein BpHYR1_045470 [Brachionus plicatilis]|uniref:Uncharacterized protein n=1 Tax=Brachionus plicatilis TaxID=10195 RepID=A0A3M7QFH4_BRAPC|nr:hypothetical protein BpHYR1_045470 [Brachionus plicatilis]
MLKHKKFPAITILGLRSSFPLFAENPLNYSEIFICHGSHALQVLFPHSNAATHNKSTGN